MNTKIEIPIRDRIITIETGELATQAGASVVVTCGDTVVLVNATSSHDLRKGIDFFPLLVDYEEKMYAVGRIPGSFTRREGRATENAILTSRLIDRSIRPLFPDGYRYDVQVVAYVLSADQINQPDILGLIGASAALSISEIPFLGPIGAVRMGYINGEYIINPSFVEKENSQLDMIISGSKDAIFMIEAGAKLLPEEDVLKAIDVGYQECQRIADKIKELTDMVGKQKKIGELYAPNQAIKDFILEDSSPKIKELLNIKDIILYKEQSRLIVKEYEDKIKQLDEKHPVRLAYAERPYDLAYVLSNLEKKEMRRIIMQEKRRVDDRALNEIRPISSKVGFLPRTHGSGLFTRGLTQVMSIATLGSASDAQRLDEVESESTKRYLHHYNFPGFSTGEIRPMRAPGRREIGHGALASRAIEVVLPSEEEFPYTIRVVSEVLSSNGSTSMASTCGSTLALMDAGVPLKTMISGIAMGLIKEGEDFAILSDIQGLEDFLGDMDFKVAGSHDGITALQMDIKTKGISLEIIKSALAQAKEGRIHILKKMEEVIDKPRADLSPYAPRIIFMQISPEYIGEVIGPSGKNIKKIIEETGVKIDIEDDGKVHIVTNDSEGGKRAKEWIERITQRVEIGRIYKGKVTKTTSYGAFVEVYPQQEGMVHISQLANRHIATVEEIVNVGDEIDVRVTDIDHIGKIYLTCKGLDEEFNGGGRGGYRRDGGGGYDRDRGRRGDYQDRDRGRDRDRGGGDRPFDRKRY